MTDHPLDQLDPHTPSSDSVNSAASTRKSDTFRESWGSSKSTSEEVNPEASNQSLHSRPASQQLTRPPSVFSQASNYPSEDNLSTTSSTAQEKTLSEPLSALRVLETIFAEDVYGPTIKTELPQPQKRIEITQKLVYCNVLLLQDTLFSPKVAKGKDADSAGPLVLLERALDKTELDWLETTRRDPMEANRLRWLATRMVEPTAEIVALGTVLEKEPYRKLLSTFIKEFDDTRSTYRTHLHSTKHSYHFTLAVSRILDVMADHKVQDLDRVLEREPLTAFLSELKGSSDPYLLYQACYAF
ncbi:hypothetical protein BGZ88_003334 [Linnemannia elongata]|nr:hypothetical protein BGZ88_003334 [Linnemannia elongata]